jgi:cytochrome c556
MKARHKHIAAVALGALLIAGAAPAAGPAKPADQRSPLVLLDEERHIVLEEMRNFLAVLQTITDALTREDMKEIARAARSMGSGAANEIPPKTVAKLPEEFKVLAGGVHTTFDLMALDAESLADPKHTLTQMNELLQKCNACHGIYQIKVGKGGAVKAVR